MEPRPMTTRTAHRPRWWWSVAVGVLAGVSLLAGACVPGDDDVDGSTLDDVDREHREDGDVEGRAGDPLEVYGITATALEWGRVEAYGELEDWGYIWVRVQVENTTNGDVDYHRRQFRLEKPDGTVSNTANIVGETQVPGVGGARPNQIPPGETREGQVIYTVGELDGQFALVYEPEPPTADPLDVERGIWVFESSPEDAE